MKLLPLARRCGLTVCAASIAPILALAQLSSNVTVFASGLEGPRGLKFGPHGYLYVAEAGTGGTTSTAGQCTQVVPPIGPYTNGNTGRISRIDSSGHRTTVASGFPSSQAGDPTKDTSSVGDVAFVNGELYAVLAGGGCSHGSASIPNAIVKVDLYSGRWKVVADLSAFLQSHPAMYTNVGDFEPDGTFYSLIALNGQLYTVEPNHGQVLSITPWGKIGEVVDISKAEGHIVPTSIAARGADFYVGNLGTFAIVPNSAKILTLSRGFSDSHVPGLDWPESWGSYRVAGSRAGFTTVVAVDFGPDGLLYALELSAAAGDPTPGEGKVVRLNANGDIQDIATGLSVPTAMTFGPDGALYVSNFGAAPAGAGEIVRVEIP